MQETWGSIPGLGRSPGGWHGNPLQYSCLENPHGQRSPEGYNPWGCKESDMTERLSIYTVKPGSFSRSHGSSYHAISARLQSQAGSRPGHTAATSVLCFPRPPPLTASHFPLWACSKLRVPRRQLYSDATHRQPRWNNLSSSQFSVILRRKDNMLIYQIEDSPIFLCQNLTLKFLFHSSEGAARCFVLFFK